MKFENLDANESIANGDVSASAAIAATKLIHREVVHYRQANRQTTHRVRSVWLDLDNGAAATIDDVVAKPQVAITVTAARVIYQDATTGTVAGGDVRLGTALAGSEIVAATNYENTKAVGTKTELTIAAGAVAADGSVFIRHTGVAATQAGQAAVEIDYTIDEENEVVAATVPIHTVRGATGTIIAIEATVTTAATTPKSLTIDLKKSTGGGAFATVLTGVMTIDSTTTVRTIIAGALAATTLVDGDHLQLVIAVSGASGTQSKDLSVTVQIEEAP